MATAFITSTKEKQISDSTAALIEDGKLPKPPNADHEAHTCADCGGFTIMMPMCTDCAIAHDQWQEVLQMADSAAPYTFDHYQNAIDTGFLYYPYETYEERHPSYDATCGMQSRQEWAFDFMMTIWETWMKEEVASWARAHWDKDFAIWIPIGKIGLIKNIGPNGFKSAAHIYLAAIGVHRLNSKPPSVFPENMGWYATAVYDWFARRRIPDGDYKLTEQPEKKTEEPNIPAEDTEFVDMLNKLNETPKPEPQTKSDYDYVAEAERVCKLIARSKLGYEIAKQREKAWLDARAAALQARGIVFPVHPKQSAILPQQLQSNSEVLEAIAMSKLSVSPERIAEMEEAVKFAIENWVNIQARVLFDGYKLKQGGFTVMLKHPSHPSGVTVGLTDPTTHKLSFVARRGEIREFMHKVAAGMKPSDNPKLPGIMLQAPIPDRVKMSAQLRTLKSLTESTETFMAVLNDGKDGTG